MVLSACIVHRIGVLSTGCQPAISLLINRLDRKEIVKPAFRSPCTKSTFVVTLEKPKTIFVMSKGMDKKKEAKKPATKTLKEKRAEKRAKKEGRN